jgi:hypothetical protein
MKLKVLLKTFIISFSSLIVFSVAQAQFGGFPLIQYETVVRQDVSTALHFFDEKDAVTRFRDVQLNSNIKSWSAVQEGNEITLNLFPDTWYNSTVISVEQYLERNVTITAGIQTYDFAYMIISTTDDRTLVNIHVPEQGRQYQITSDPFTNVHYLVEIDPSRLKEVEHYPPLIPPPPNAEEQEEINKIKEELKSTLQGPYDPAVIDVMIVYTPAAATWGNTYGGGIQNLVATAMATAQLCLTNSQTVVTMRLVYSSQVTYTESGNSNTDLDRLRITNDGHMDIVHTWRNTYGADLVQLFTTAGGGIGYLLSNSAGNPAYAFSIAGVSTATAYTPIHEMGHNMGCHHHKQQNYQPGPGLWSYSAGWRWVGTNSLRYCDLMTYESGTYFPDGYTHSRVPHFSNPVVNFAGVATGDYTDGDNAWTIQNIKHVIAAYRSTSTVAGVWLGSVSSDWHNPLNWLNEQVPTMTTDVTRKSGTPNQPVITGTAYCRNLSMEQNTTLTQNSGSYFHVYGTFDVGLWPSSYFTMLGSSFLYFRGDSDNNWWDDYNNGTYSHVRVNKSTTTVTTYMQYNSSLSGTFQIWNGRFAMSSGRTLTVNGISTGAFRVDDGGTLELGTDRIIDVASTIVFQNGSQAVVGGGTIMCGGNFTIENNTSTNIQLTNATVVLKGTGNQLIQDIDGNSIHHLTIDKPSGTASIDLANLSIAGNLVINSGTFSIGQYTCNVAGNTTIAGILTMNHNSGILNAMGNVAWNSGSTVNINSTAVINVYGNWNFNAGSNVNFANGFVDFRGSTFTWIRCYSENSSFNNLRIYKTGGASASFSNLSTNDLVINGLLFISSTAIFHSYANENIIIKGQFNYYGQFDFTMNMNTGSVVFDGGTQSINNYGSGSGKFSNVVFNSSTGTTVVNGDLLITRNLTINQGYFSPGANTVTIRGSWTNNNFPDGFITGTGMVIFNGTTDQYVHSSENFNILQANMGGVLRVNNAAHTVTCNQYSWVTGGIHVLAGTFTALDLAQNGIYGSFSVNSGGTINLTNSGTNTWVDLNGELYIFGGTMNITGSICDWAFAGNAVVEMSGGMLDFKTCGIGIPNTTYTLTTNITGGTIRTAYGYYSARATFTPAAGTFEFYGANDVTISQSNGSTLYNVEINKSAKEASGFIPEIQSADGRDGLMLGDESKANMVTLGSNFTITGNLNIGAGTFNLGSYSCNVTGTTDISGALQMTNSANDLTSHTVSWNSGSDANVTAGTFHAQTWYFNEGTIAKLGTGNTTYLITLYFPTSNEAEFGNLIRVTGAKDMNGEKGKAYYPVRVMGYLILESGVILSYHTSGSDLIVAGDATIQSGASIAFSAADFIVGGTLDLSGTLTLQNRSAMVSGGFLFPETGILNIWNGEFIADHPHIGGWQAISGAFNMTSGLFELTNNSPNFGTIPVSVSGGTIRTGRAFAAYSPNTFQPTGGVVELVNTSTTWYALGCYNGNYFHNLLIDAGGAVFNQEMGDLIVNKNFTIQNGQFRLHNEGGDLYIKGNWINNVGSTGFVPHTNKVIFNGSSTQNIQGNTNFYDVYNAQTGGQLQFQGGINITNDFLANGINVVSGPSLNVGGYLNLSSGGLQLVSSGPNVTVNNFMMGGTLTVDGGSFSCNDITNNGIYGTINLTDGSIILYQDAMQYSDLNANVTINGGSLAVNGGNGLSHWGYGASCSLNMTDGVLVFHHNGVLISSFYNITQNITGGIIKTNRSVIVDHPDYTPAGGTVELYDGDDASISAKNGGHFYNLLINKSGGSKGQDKEQGMNSSESAGKQSQLNSFASISEVEPGKRSVLPVNASKANQVSLYDELKVMNNTTINAGILRLTEYPVTSMGDILVNSGGTLQLTGNASLAIGSGKSLTVNNGGVLDVMGTDAEPATITRHAGHYGLNIESGGTIGAVHGIFEYMNTGGVNIKSGALVDPAKPFNYCTFRLGQSGGRLMTIQNNQNFYVENAVFPANTWGGSYNVYKSVNIGQVHFVTATGGFAGESYEYDPNNRIHWTNRQLALKAYLEGPFSGGAMKTTLNPVLPLSHPFNPALPYFGNPMPDWYYTGAGSVAAIPNADIVDWVLIDVRDAVDAASATPATSIARFPAFIAENGAITDLTGASKPDLTNAITNNLFVAVYHRNHVGIMNAVPIPYAMGVYSYDFTTGATQVYGGVDAHKQLPGGAWGMMSGDGDGNGEIEMADKTNVWTIQAGTEGYKAGDYNMNRQVNNPDKDDQWLPNLGKGSYIP